MSVETTCVLHLCWAGIGIHQHLEVVDSHAGIFHTHRTECNCHVPVYQNGKWNIWLHMQIHLTYSLKLSAPTYNAYMYMLAYHETCMHWWRKWVRNQKMNLFALISRSHQVTMGLILLLVFQAVYNKSNWVWLKYKDTIVCPRWVELSKNANNLAVLHAIHRGLVLIYSVQKCTIYM